MSFKLSSLKNDIVLDDIPEGEGNPRLVDVFFDRVLRVTDGAALYLIGDEEYWIPRSQTFYVEEERATVSEWIALEKGLI